MAMAMINKSSEEVIAAMFVALVAPSLTSQEVPILDGDVYNR